MLLVAIKVWRQKYGGLLSFVFFSLAFSLGEIIFEISVLNVLSKNVLSKMFYLKKTYLELYPSCVFLNSDLICF